MAIDRATIERLVKHFERLEATGASRDLKEAAVRDEFINPFFEALGWDVRNVARKAPRFKDVLKNETVRRGEETKEPDYTFRIGGGDVFYLEAKKPAVIITTDREPALQLRRYSWPAESHLFGVLTNFRDLLVYDRAVRPSPTDGAMSACLLRLRFDEYLPRLDELASLLTREGIEGAEHPIFTQTRETRRGTLPFDDQFLAQLEAWRLLLGRSIASANPELDAPAVTLVVQRIIDRLLFLRICEDKGIEPYRTLDRIAGQDKPFARLVKLFHYADRRFNSGLFHFRPAAGRSEEIDRLTTSLSVPDAPVVELLRGLYPPSLPYAFGALPPDILGQVYERFLGNVLEIHRGRRVRAVPKEEVRRAGAIYYTPAPVVRHIVHSVLEPLLQTHAPDFKQPLRVLDPACGSGSFLVEAYLYLLDWYLDRFTASPSATRAALRKGLLVRDGGTPRLSLDARRRILLAHVHGVDVDRNAVEVTKLSLLIQMLAPCAPEIAQVDFDDGHESLLPDLGRNIVAGNSIIEPDFESTSRSAETRSTISALPMRWDEAFPDVTAAGGFDAIIGNPPYDKVSRRETPYEYDYLKQHFPRTAQYKIELYAVFIERVLQLLREGGLHSFIVPNSFLAGVYLEDLRNLMALDNTLVDLAFLQFQVFRAAKLDSVIYIVKREKPTPATRLRLRKADESFQTIPEGEQVLTVKQWQQSAGRTFAMTTGAGAQRLVRELEQAPRRLSDLATIHLGLVPKSNDLVSDSRTSTARDGLLRARDFGRYEQATPIRWFDFAHTEIAGGTKDAAVYQTGPRIVAHAIRNLRIPRRLVCGLAEAGTFTDGTVHNILPKPGVDALTLLGILDSNVIDRYYAARFPEHRIKGEYLKSLPMPELSRRDAESIAKLVRQRIEANAMPDPLDRERQIRHCERELDAAVAQAFGLSEAAAVFVARTAAM